MRRGKTDEFTMRFSLCTRIVTRELTFVPGSRERNSVTVPARLSQACKRKAGCDDGIFEGIGDLGRSGSRKRRRVGFRELEFSLHFGEK